MNICSEAFDLLLGLLETPSLVFTHDAVFGRGPALGMELIAAGLLVEHDIDPYVVDGDGSHHVDMHPRCNELGYHSPSEGWVRVDREKLRRFKPDLKALFVGLIGEDVRMTGAHPIPMDDDWIWEIGALVLVGAMKTSIWLARRLTSRDAVHRLAGAMKRRPDTSRLILATTPHDRLVEERVEAAKIIPIKDILSPDKPGRIDLAMLRERFEGRTETQATEPVWLSDDGRQLRILREEFKFSGSKQIAAIKVIVEAYRTGIAVKFETIRELSHSNARDPDALFGHQWQRLKRYVVSDRGHYTIRLPDPKNPDRNLDVTG